MTGPQPFQLPQIGVTVDVVLFTRKNDRTLLVLVERGHPPYQGSWALPGGFVEVDEDLPDAAVRELTEETGIELPVAELALLGVYGEPGRDPRMRVVSIVFWAATGDLSDPVGGSDAASSRLVPLDEVLADGFDLAFDHRRIVEDAIVSAGLG